MYIYIDYIRNCFNKYDKKAIYAVEFKDNVKKFLNENYKKIDSVTFAGEYNLEVNLNMNT